MINKFNAYKKSNSRKCIICNKNIYMNELNDIEVIQTKRKSIIFAHKNCIKEGEENGARKITTNGAII